MIRLEMWGTCGSITSPGRDRMQHGGNTSCVQVIAYDNGTPGASGNPDNPRVTLDAGSGLLALQEILMSGPAGKGRGWLHLLLTHYHWDHVTGLPTFVPLFVPGNRVSFYGASRHDLEECISTLFTSAYSPMKGVHNLASEIDYVTFNPKGMQVGGFHVTAARTNHPGTAWAYRLEHNGNSVVYAPDHEAGATASDHRLVELARGADVWLLDGMYTKEELPKRRGWGHSTPLDSVRLALEAGVKTLILFHHCPDYSDSTLDRMEREARQAAAGTGLEVLSARDCMVHTIG